MFGAPLTLDPRALVTAQDVSVAGALYETLYAIDAEGTLVPRLARDLPEVRGTQVIVPLKDGLLSHDQRAIGPAEIAAWMQTLADPDSRSAHVVLPVKGARARLADGRSHVAIEAMPNERALAFDLVEPYADFPRLLASPHAGVALPRSSGSQPRVLEAFGVPGAGTGPWMIDPSASATGELVLLPFLQHSSGRPFLDTLIVRESSSRFGTMSQLKKGEAAAIFGVPDTRAVKRHELIPWTAGKLPGELVVLSVGRSSEGLRTPEMHREISAALNRDALAHRFLGAGSEPASTLFGDLKDDPPAASAPRARIDAHLTVAKDDRAAHRIAERVQLDLLRAGVTVTIDWVSASTIELRRKDKRYDLMLDSLYPDWPGGSLPADRFHALLSLVAATGALYSAISPEELTAFARASDPERRRLIAELEPQLRVRAGIVPIAVRLPAVAVRADLRDWAMLPFGRLDLSNAFFSTGARSE
jgi:ABC-type transport system substrate-binding protein